jgi:hypothetical protein
MKRVGPIQQLAAAEISEQHVIASLKEVLPTLTNAIKSLGTREELGKGDRTLSQAGTYVEGNDKVGFYISDFFSSLVITAISPFFLTTYGSLKCSPYRFNSQSSGSISPIISPPSNIRTTEPSDTTTAIAFVTLLMEADAMCLLPRPRGNSIPSETAEIYRHAETTTPWSETIKAPSSCASSFTVSRILRSSICLFSGACPSSGSRIIFRDSFNTFSWSDTIKIVPIFRPSRPSRAISTARRITDSKVYKLIPRFFVQISQNNSSILGGSIFSYTALPSFFNHLKRNSLYINLSILDFGILFSLFCQKI